MIGTIVAVQYGVYSVEVDGVIYQTSPRGVFRKNSIKPVVGDIVELDEGNFIIRDVLARKSYLKRPSIANIDQILLVFSLSEPSFSYFLALKYLTYCNYQGVKASLVLTKTDKSDEEEIKRISKDFASIKIDTYLVSNKTKEGVDEIRKILEGKISCLMGQTGAGKSSLLNSIDENYNRDIGEYSKALGRGKHQTKEVILLPYLNGYIADTPGFSSLELDMKETDVARYFPGMEEDSLKCFYPNCLHVSEPKCAVKDKFLQSNIPSIIYECYLKLLEEVKENHHG